MRCINIADSQKCTCLDKSHEEYGVGPWAVPLQLNEAILYKPLKVEYHLKPVIRRVMLSEGESTVVYSLYGSRYTHHAWAVVIIARIAFFFETLDFS